MFVLKAAVTHNEISESIATVTKTRLFVSLNSSHYTETFQLHRFYVPFWLRHTLVYLFYLCPSFCPSWDRSIINKQSYGKTEKGRVETG